MPRGTLYPELAEAIRGRAGIREALARAVEQHAGEAAALAPDGKGVTYQQLWRQSQALRRGLTAAGVSAVDDDGRPVVVAVIVDRQVDAMAAMIAVVTRGAAVLPLSPQLPEPYLAQVLEACEARFVLGRDPAHLLGGAAGMDLGAIAEQGRLLLESEVNGGGMPRPVQVGQTACVVGVAGPRGPVGVLLSHTALLETVAAMVEVFGQAGRVLLPAPGAECYPAMLLWALLTGGPVVTGDQGCDPVTVARWIVDHEVTDVVFPFSRYEALLDQPAMQGVVPVRRVLLVGGQPADPGLVNRHALQLPESELGRVYGMAEAGGFVSHTRLYPAMNGTPWWGPLGESGSRMQIVQTRMLPDLEGLLISSPQLAAGYVGDDTLTSQRFSRREGRSVLLTGDRFTVADMRWWAFTDRTDRQTTIDGLRVEPCAVEAYLAALPDVAGVCVTPDAHGRLIAHVALTGHGESRLAEVEASAARELPAQMVPSAWRLVDARRIDAQDPAALVGGDAAGSLAHVVHAMVRATIERVTRQRAVDLDRPLNDPTADLRMLRQVVGDLELQLSTCISLARLGPAPTPRELALVTMKSLNHAGHCPSVLSMRASQGTAISGQQRQAWTTGGAGVAWSLQLHGCLDVAALTEAVRAVVEHHEVLRTTFAASEDGLTATTGRASGPSPQIWHVDGPSIVDPHSFVVAAEPAPAEPRLRTPAAWVLERRGGSAWALRVLAPPWVVDHAAWREVVTDLQAAYSACTAGREPGLAAPAVRYGDWASRQDAWLSTGGAAAESYFWLLHPVSTGGSSSFPADGSIEPTPERACTQTISTTVDVSTVEELDRLCMEHKVTRAAAVLAVLVLLLRESAAPDRGPSRVIGVEVAGRRHPGLRRLIGPVACVRPVEVFAWRGQTKRELITSVTEALLAAEDHCQAPPDLVAAQATWPVWLSVYDEPAPVLQADGLTGHWQLDYTGTAGIDLHVTVLPLASRSDSARPHDGITVQFHVPTGHYQQATLRRQLDRFTAALRELAQPATWAEQAPAPAFQDVEHLSIGEQ